MRELESFYNTQIDEMPMVRRHLLLLFRTVRSDIDFPLERCRPHLSGLPKGKAYFSKLSDGYLAGRLCLPARMPLDDLSSSLPHLACSPRCLLSLFSHVRCL